MSYINCQTQLQLENPTQLQLVWVGVDFVFPRKNNKKNKKNNPHLAFSRGNDPTCLIFSDCLVCVWRVYGNCLESVWQVFFCCLEGVLRVSGRCLKGVWRESMGCLNGILVSQDWWSQDRSSQDRSSQDRSSQDMSSYDRSTHDRAIKDRYSQDKLSQDRSSQDRSSQDRSSQDRSSFVRTQKFFGIKTFLDPTPFWTKIFLGVLEFDSGVGPSCISIITVYICDTLQLMSCRHGIIH